MNALGGYDIEDLSIVKGKTINVMAPVRRVVDYNVKER